MQIINVYNRPKAGVRGFILCAARTAGIKRRADLLFMNFYEPVIPSINLFFNNLTEVANLSDMRITFLDTILKVKTYL